MPKLPNLDKSGITIGLSTLLLIGLSTWMAGKTSPRGLVQLQPEMLYKIVFATSSVFLGLLSYLVVLWRRDLKRQRVRFARENGRKICPCSATGEIMQLRDKHTAGGSFKALFCPKCNAWLIADETMYLS
jgi:hypothetical protein